MRRFTPTTSCTSFAFRCTRPTVGRGSEQILLEAAQIECSPFLDQARLYMKNIETQHGLDSPTVAPRVTLQIPEPGKDQFPCFAFPAPSRRKGRLEQAILRRYLSQISKSAVNESNTPFP